MPDLLKDVERYWDSHHLGTQFLSGTTADVGSREYFVEFDRAMERWDYKNRLIDWIASEYRNGTLLEVGCGLGQDLAKFAGCGLAVTAIDLAQSVASMASKHLAAYGLRGSILQGDAQALSFPDDTFDVVYSCGVFQHIPNIQHAVDEVYRVLRKGGTAVIVVYHRYSWLHVLSMLARVNIEFEDKDPPILNTYSKRRLRQIFSKFHRIQMELEYCYPTPTPRTGTLPTLYNRVCIPVLRSIPYTCMKHFGWHAVVKATK
jgi:ubiquinone/menaquinone biosynthesis C-methylase UbiE